MNDKNKISNEEVSRRKTRACPGCHGTSFDHSLEELNTVCQKCGLVIQDFASTTSAPNQCLDLDRQLSKDQSQESWSDFYTVTNSTERQVATAIKILEKGATALSISDEIRLRASEILGKAMIKNFTDGYLLESAVGAVLYLSASECGKARPVPRLSDCLDAKRSEVNYLIRLFQVELELEYVGRSPEDYLPFLQIELEYSPEVVERAQSVLENARTEGLVNGRNPTGVAGAALYYSGNGEHSQTDIARKGGVSQETIRLRLKEFREGGLLNE